jgi:hypothetical protein
MNVQECLGGSNLEKFEMELNYFSFPLMIRERIATT